MLINMFISLSAILVMGCALLSFRQFKKDYSSDCEKVVAESMAARSNKVALDLADAYQMPDELGMAKIKEVEKCKLALFQYESDYFLAVEELECQSFKKDNITFLRARS